MRAFFPLLLLIILSPAFPCAKAAAAGERVFSMESAIERALLVSPLAKEAEFKTESAALDLKKFKRQKYLPDIKVRVTTGLVPEARGDVLSSEDSVNDLNGLAPFYKVDVEAFKPLYTFGMLGAAINAATEGARFEQAKRDLVIEEINLRVVKAYWALYYASKALSLASELREKFDEILQEVRSRLEDENSGVDDSDYLKLKASAFAVHEGYEKSFELKKISRIFLFKLLDLNSEEEYEFSKEKSPLFKVTDGEMDRAYEVSMDSTPLIRGTNSAVEGLKSRLDVAKSHRYPVIFLGARFRYANAENRSDQSNPFVVDDFNYSEVGAALGLEWKPDFNRKSIEVSKSRLAYFAAMEKRKAVELKAGLDARRALFRVEKNKALLKASKNSLKAAKSWLRLSGDNWEMGIGDIDSLIEAYRAYYKLRGVELDISNKYNSSLADLAHTWGGMKLYLKWLKAGRVSFD